jgi:hypothetical protein
MLGMAAFCDDVLCDDDPDPCGPKPGLVDEVVALARRVTLAVVVRAPTVVVTREPPSREGGAEVHEVLVRGFIALRSHTALLGRNLGASSRPPARVEGPRRA